MKDEKQSTGRLNLGANVSTKIGVKGKMSSEGADKAGLVLAYGVAILLTGLSVASIIWALQ